MIDYKAAHEVLVAAGGKVTLTNELVSLLVSVGRVTAQDIFATDDNPRFDHSAMDGYAICAQWSEGASQSTPKQIPAHGILQAGDSPITIDEAAVEIMTGAPIPEGLDAVVRIEDVTVLSDRIEIRRPVTSGDNIRRTGEDFRKDELLIACGTRLGHQHILTLAVSGIAQILVRRCPKVVLISTGNELVSFDAPEVHRYAVRNSTAPYLKSVLGEVGCHLVDCLTALDTKESLRAALEQARALKPDLILTQGGVSAGKFDLVPEIVGELGGQICFHKVAIRPGKPVLFAELDDCFVLGMPGNPISTVVALRFFLKPFIQSLLGEDVEQPSLRPLAREISVPKSLLCFQRGVEEHGVVRPLQGQGSGMVKSFATANGWIAAVASGEAITKGSEVAWYPLF